MSLAQNYTILVSRLKYEIQSSRIKASLSANAHLLILYWKIGKTILENQAAEGWGTKLIDRLAKNLRHEFPDMKGFSVGNLKYMRAFADAYPHFLQEVGQANESSRLQPEQINGGADDRLKEKQIVQAPLAQMSEDQIVQVSLAQITWYHHITLLDKVKTAKNASSTYSKRAKMVGAVTYWCTRLKAGCINAKGLPLQTLKPHSPSLKAILQRSF